MTTAVAEAESAEPKVVERVRHLIESGQWGALREYPVRILSSERTEAAQWFAKNRRFLLADARDWRQYGAGRSIDQSWDLYMAIHVLTVVLDSPVSAAKFLPWRSFPIRTVHILLLLDLLVSRGEGWCRGFVGAAMARNAGSGERSAINVVRCCLPLMLHFGIDPKDFEAYPRQWARYYRNLVGAWSHEVWNDESAAHFDCSGWSGVEFRIGRDGRAELFPKMQKSLLELWDQDATAPETLLRCFDRPNLLGTLVYRLDAENWRVGAAVRGYLDRGTFSRESVMAHVLSALARGDSMPTQRALLDVLKVLNPDPQEMAASMPLWLSTVAPAPGFLSDFALELLLKTPLDGPDLEELSATVFGRPEKNLQKRMVRHLKAGRANGNYDGAVVAACWEAASGSSDLEIQAIAAKFPGTPPIPAESGARAAALLWGTGAQKPAALPLVELDAASTRFETWSSYQRHTIVEEQYLALFLRKAYHQPQEGRDWYRRTFPVHDRTDGFEKGLAATAWGWWSDPNPRVALSMWASERHDRTAHGELVRLIRSSFSEPFDWGDPFRRTNPVAAIRTLRVSELTVQAGAIGYSLATPGYNNHRVNLDRLVAVLGWYDRERLPYGEADLFQALLRLEPTTPEDATELPELGIRPLDGCDDPLRTAGRLIRDWIQGGGFVPPVVDAPLVLPVSLERFPSIPSQLLEANLWEGGDRTRGATWLGSGASAVVPFWPDLGAVWFSRKGTGGELVAMRPGGLDGAIAGDVGALTHEWLLEMLSSAMIRTREQVLETTLELAATGQLSSMHLAAAVKPALNRGSISLGRLVRSLALVAYEGHLDCVWPALVALLLAVREQQRLPAGTPELLAFCTEFWDSIPAGLRTPEDIPGDFAAAVRALASSQSATKTVLEANRLLSAMTLEPPG